MTFKRFILFDDLTPEQNAQYVVWIAHHNVPDDVRSFARFVLEEILEEQE